MRIICLDVGDKRVGVAVSDGLGLTAQGITALERARVFEELKKVIDEYEAVSIVVGMPRMLNGTVGIQGEKVLKFVEELKAEISLPVSLWDERLSTAAAERVLIEADMSRKKRKSVRDKVAAAVILQSYLDSRDR